MITIGAGQTFYGSATAAASVNYTIGGLLMTNGSPPVATGYSVLTQGQFSNTAASVYSPGASATAVISAISLFNTSAVTAQVVNLYAGGSVSANQMVTLTLPGGGWAEYEGGGNGWFIYNSSGLPITNQSIGTPSYGPGGVGTPASSAQSLSAGSANLVAGTSVALTTGQLFVGSWYRFSVNVKKTTAAGVATWAAMVKFGTANTTSDSAIATWTSGTNTGAIDDGQLIIDVYVTGLGSGTSATANCTCQYVNSLTVVTGLGDIAFIPSPTAGFNSTAASPYWHIDITPGASAVMTAIGSAQRMV